MITTRTGPLLKVMTVMVQGGGGGGSNYSPKKPAVKAPKRPAPLKQPSYGITGVKATPKKNYSGSTKKSYKAPSRSYSSGKSYSSKSYSGGGSSSSVGSSATGRISAAAPKPPSLADYLGTDSAFVQQKAALAKAMSDYKAQQGQSQTQYLTGYTGDLDTLGKNRTSSLGDLENDYAGRGLLQSGLYADSMSDMNTDYDKRQSALEQAKAAFLAQLSGDLTNFTSEQDLTLARAKQEAAARRTAQYGI